MKGFHFLIPVLFLALHLPVRAQELPADIQQKILDAFGRSAATRTDQFDPVIRQLEEAAQGEPATETQNTIGYWLGFARYRQAVFQMTTGAEEVAGKTLDLGIAQMKAQSDPDSEDHALLGTMLSLAINFHPEKAAILSGQAMGHYEKAVRKNDRNLRAYLGIGRSDFFTPAAYGGGQKVESFLKQALTKPDAGSDRPFAPTWGRDEVYYYLASYYHREGRPDEARLYCHQGLKAFPDHFLLKQLQSKIQ